MFYSWQEKLFIVRRIRTDKSSYFPETEGYNAISPKALLVLYTGLKSAESKAHRLICLVPTNRVQVLVQQVLEEQ